MGGSKKIDHCLASQGRNHGTEVRGSQQAGQGLEVTRSIGSLLAYGHCSQTKHGNALQIGDPKTLSKAWSADLTADGEVTQGLICPHLNVLGTPAGHPSKAPPGYLRLLLRGQQ